MFCVLCKKYGRLKTLFTITSNGAFPEKPTLLMEVGADYCCYAFYREETRSFERITQISFDEHEAYESLVSIVSELKNQQFERVFFCSAFAQALLMPQKFFANSDAVLDIIYDIPSSRHLNDYISEWQMVNVYSIPSAMHEMITSGFSGVQFFHAYTPLIKVFNHYEADQQIHLYFTTQYFRVLVKKEQQVQLAQIYAYKSPLDVAYYLLKMVYEFDLDQTQVHVILSGLVDEKSALFDEIHHYFIHVKFAQHGNFNLPENDFPEYYFSSLYNLAGCVS